MFFFHISVCYIIAEGFWFMPLSLVRRRTFRLSAWVIWVHPWCRWYRVRAHRVDMSLRCHNSQRRNGVTGCGWRHAPKARGCLCENLKKVMSRVLDAKRRGSTFGARRREANLRPNGAARVGYKTPNEKDRLLELTDARRTCGLWGSLELGAKWIRQHRRLCLSSLRRNL